MTIGYRFLLATVQEVTARMFTTTFLTPWSFSRIHISKLPQPETPAESTKRTKTMQVTETPPLADVFPPSQAHPNIKNDTTFLSFFFNRKTTRLNSSHMS